MTQTIEEALREFHQKMDGLPGSPGTPGSPYERKRLRFSLMREEFEEVNEALFGGSPQENDEAREHLAKELADLVYVVVGTAVAYDIPFDAVFQAVHDSNMSKLSEGAAFREDGKLLKGDAYIAPDLKEAMNA